MILFRNLSLNSLMTYAYCGGPPRPPELNRVSSIETPAYLKQPRYSTIPNTRILHNHVALHISPQRVFKVYKPWFKLHKKFSELQRNSFIVYSQYDIRPNKDHVPCHHMTSTAIRPIHITLGHHRPRRDRSTHKLSPAHLKST